MNLYETISVHNADHNFCLYTLENRQIFGKKHQAAYYY